VKVAVAGAGRIGRSIIIGSSKMDGIKISAVADIQLKKCQEALKSASHTDKQISTIERCSDAEDHIEDGNIVITQNALLLSRLNKIDVLVCATGIPEVGAKLANRAILNSINVVMITDETDAVIGPYLSKLAEETGITYCAAAGDEPGAIMELYSFANSLGFEIVALGKGKNNPLDRTATPSGIQKDAEKKGLNPNIYTSFIDGTNTMLEMTMVANATGLTVDTFGMHGPEVSEIEALPETFSQGEGILSRTGVVDFALGGSVAPGVFAVVKTDNDTIQDDLAYLDIGTGPNYCFHRGYHLPTIEPLLSAARAQVNDDAYLIPSEPTVDTIAVAKTDISAGDNIDGIGGRTVYGMAIDANVAISEDLVPISLINDAVAKTSIQHGSKIRYDDIQLKQSELLSMRRIQDSHFN
jgi:predicted homoserine dehydrogenase-like protein